MTVQIATNIVWHGGNVSKKDREELLRQKGVALWFTGLSGSGKSTLAGEIEKRLFAGGHLSYVLDGDNIRFGLNKNLGFSPEDRAENIRRIGEVAKLFADAGIITLTAFISPYRADRDTARGLLKEGEFIEVFVKCPVLECEKRDTKGLYKKARAGEIKEFTGISAPYEEPVSPELVVDTARLTLDEAADLVIRYLADRGITRQ
ncbi:MAG: adenylyl-sulfate kinase [Firmicutes bacterium HGW-Firmicutes-8]|nr:MAG: adenylyl-sulfate kinase [Firmicutes bacterium HGW-Firmicutes-8]